MARRTVSARTLSLGALLAAACTPVEFGNPSHIQIPPAVTFLAPADQATFTNLDSIELTAMVADGNGLDDVTSVRFASNLQGPLDFGEEAHMPDPSGLCRLTVMLGTGVHSIEVGVTDSDGLQATDAITLRVEESDVMPHAEILEPADLDVFDIGTDIALLGVASDPNQASNTLWARWGAVSLSSGASIDLGDFTPGDDGSTGVTIVDPPQDVWIVGLEVTDDDGNIAIDRIQITVRDPDDLDNDLDGWTVNENDCDDADPDVFPGNVEVCDGRDNDCDGTIDDKDADLDHHIDLLCTAYPGPLFNDDCDDLRSDVFPGSVEVPDNVDQDCDNAIDQGTIRYDDDGDCFCEGPGNCTGSIEPACALPSVAPGDCDDTDLFVSPADFDLDGVAGCDGDCDDRDAVMNANDVDTDGVTTCDGDCDDDPAACGADCFPGHIAVDLCDGWNQDCDATADEDPDIAWYPDSDLDGYTDADRKAYACLDPDAAALRWVAAATVEDCDDTNPALNPADIDGDGFSTCALDCDDDPSACGAGCFPGNLAADVCDGVNQDCDAAFDENPELAWYHDADGDGWTDLQDTSFACADPDGAGIHWVAVATLDDCDDLDLAMNFDDADIDGFSTCEGDCDDADALLDPADIDLDGWSTCDGDCDDDPDPSACGADCFPENPAPDVCDDFDQDCDTDFDEEPDVGWFHDADGDGYTTALVAAFDCDDPDGTGMAWVSTATTPDCDDDILACGADCFPGNAAADLCDSQNQDCDTQIDENPDIAWYHDLDGDGFTHNTDSVLSCTDPDGLDIHWLAATTTNDCDDSPTSCGVGCWPGNPAADVCDGRNQDCDASLDENPDITWYRDGDLDHWTAVGGTTNACTDPDGASIGWVGTPSAPTDCDDGVATLNHDDRDTDTWDTCEGDCDDDPASCGADCFPGHLAADVCDGENQDCDALVDENPDVAWYHDVDGDGFTTAVIGTLACVDPDGTGAAWLPSPTATDCDDNPATCGAGCFPGNAAADVCDSQNQDCDAQLDENPNIAWYHDLDGDGFTRNTDTTLSCTDPDGADIHWMAGTTTNDCDDSPATCGVGCFPGNTAADVCDGRDQDCDATLDENPNITWYRDQDLDGWTSVSVTQLACVDPDGTVGGWRGTASSPTDCNDGNAALNHDDVDTDTWDTCEGDCDDSPAACGAGCFPGNTSGDVCDGRNQDCDGSLDENPDLPWYHDVDGDGFTTATVGTLACADPDGTGSAWLASPTTLDCDDNPATCGAGCFPGNASPDVCDSKNQDCDAQLDENPNISWYHDLDGDGFTRNTDTTLSCTDPDGADIHWMAGTTTNDCDDSPATCGVGCYPGNTAPDVCDGRDQDCDTTLDENPNITWYRDQDLDGWTRVGGTQLACVDPDGATIGWVGSPTFPTDCDDTNAAKNHNDFDADGFDTCQGDCDDNPLACGNGCYPGNSASDVCDGRNQDCDASTDENPEIGWYRDADGDGFTTPDVAARACIDPDGTATGWVASPTTADCDDNPAACGAGCFPGNASADVCDGRNQDCDASIDENPNLTWYHDLDGDGFTLNTDTAMACIDPDGADIHWKPTATTTDCDDSPSTCGAGCFPGNTAADVCDGRNQDCDASTDENPNISWYRDQDLDTWTAVSGSTLACTDPDGTAAGWLGTASNPTDCDDTLASKNHNDVDADTFDTCEGDCDDSPASCGNGCFPGNSANDVCDTRDQDCDGTADENPNIPWYRDQDLDGFTAPGVGTFACADPDGTAGGWKASPSASADCDDSPSTCGNGCFPGNTSPDVCDSRNQDCDALIDENPNLTWYHDLDGDAFTLNTDTVLACFDPDGVDIHWKGTATANDCDDSPATCGAGCYPTNTSPDICDSRNQDCDASIDEDPNIPWYRDQDLDGFTASGAPTYACVDPDGTGTVWRGTPSALADCDDNPAVCGAGCYPANPALDICDGRNQDCDAQLDENPNITWYHDRDGDGFTLNSDTTLACADPDGAGINWKPTSTTNDCDDNPAVCGSVCFPGNTAPDICDSKNQDCDASVDENPNITWYRDQDVDGWTSATVQTLACLDPDGTSGGWRGTATNPPDCDDSLATLNYNDTDGDGMTSCAGDCNDNNNGVRPGLGDLPDDTFTDNNCDGLDGTVSSAVLVSPFGSDTSNCGTSTSAPCFSIVWATTRARSLSRSQLFVQAGTYSGTQSWIDLYAGTPTARTTLSIYGGYNASWVRGSRTVTANAVVFSGGYLSSQAVGLKVTTSLLFLDNIVVQTPAASGQEPSGTHVGKGRSTYAINSRDSTITIRNTTLEPGSGAPGLAAITNGVSASGVQAQAGGRGGNAGDSNTTCSTSRQPGGGGGVNSACTSANGGGGGLGGSQDTSCGWSGSCAVSGNCNATGGTNGVQASTYQTNGFGWLGGGGGVEGAGGWGWDGRPWIDGTRGSAGLRAGTPSGDWWFGGNGGDGTIGQHGTGGGGGGGSGGSDDGTDDWGAGGGGGGAGGCRAPGAGSGGRAGGSSFAVFAINSTIDVRTSLFRYGNGGDGGTGGSGGYGQAPGAAGSGGSGYQSAQAGGNGGWGTWGGDSGGGGGGAGGGVYGIYALGGGAFQTGNTEANGTVGNGGAGGTTGLTGTAGQAGEKTVIKTCLISGC